MREERGAEPQVPRLSSPLKKPTPNHRRRGVFPRLQREKNRSGFAVGPILYILALVGVGAGVLFSGYSQILRGNIQITNSMSAKNDLDAASTALSATAELSTDATLFCPPRSAHQTTGNPCANAPIKLVQFGDVTDAGDIAKLPTNFAAIDDTGSPTEAGVFKAGEGIKQIDPWGHFYVYCRWENARAPGTGTAFTLISAGADGTVSTRCGDTAAQNDDRLTTISVASAIQRSALWQATGTADVRYGQTGSQVVVTATGGVEALSLTVAGTSTLAALALDTPLPIESGGTNAKTAPLARVQLGSGGVGAVGDDLFVLSATTAARSRLGATSLGDYLFASASYDAATASSVRSLLLGSGTTGDALFLATTATGARAQLEATDMGHYLFASATLDATTAALVRGTLLNSGTIGDSVFLAGTATDARDTLGATAVGHDLFTAVTATAGRTKLGAGPEGSLLFTATSQASAWEILGLTGTITATLDININGTAGSVSASNVTGTLPIAHGGTDGTTATAALDNLFYNDAGGTYTLNDARLTNVSTAYQGSYNWGTIDAKGRVIAAQNVSIVTSGITDGAGDQIWATGTGGAGWLYFQTSSTTSMALDPSGNLGIGTLTPSERLHVNGGNVLISSGTGSSAELQLAAGANSKRWTLAMTSTPNNFTLNSYTDAGVAATPLTISRATGAATFTGSVTSTGGFVGNVTGDVTGNVYGDIVGSLSLIDGTATTPALYFTNETNMGLYRDTTAAAMGFVTAGVEVLRMTATQSVGIGTMNPAAVLDIRAEGNNLALSRTGFNTQLLGIGTRNGIDGLHFTDITTGYAPISISQGAASGSFIINSSGAVGIGSVTPTTGSILDIYGTGTAFSSIILPRDITANRPTASVEGMIRYNAELHTTEVYQGFPAAWVSLLNSSATFGSGVLLGTSATVTNPQRSGDVTTGLFSGSTTSVSVSIQGTERVQANANGLNLPQIANGYYIAGTKILHHPASDPRSVAIGAAALASQTVTDRDNIAVGYYALNQASDGYQNIGMGSYALYATTTGIRNTGIGHTALYQNVNGIYNTAMGYQALLNNVSGNYNTALGSNALANTTGNNNTSVGHSSLDRATAGSGNTALGDLAMLSTTPNNLTGDYNTALGYQSLMNVQTTAASNTALGYQTGSTLTTGTNNILIGAGADVPSATQSNYLNIGNTIYGNLSTNSVGIATAPSAWGGVSKAIDIGLGAAFVGRTDLYGGFLMVNAYRDSSNTYRYKGANSATMYQFGAGTHLWYTATTGAADGEITWDDPRMMIGYDGSVGINTMTMMNKLHVEGTAAGKAGIYLNSAAPATNTYTLYNSGGTLYWNGNALLTTGTTTVSVALGPSAAAANPARSDDVTTGLFSATSATVSTTISGTERFKVNANGVDVPNITNAYYLAGAKVLFQPASDTTSIAVGSGAMAAQTAISLYSTAMGYLALNKNTTGFQNSAFGYGALYSTTTGSFNTAVGNNALYLNTSGSSNIAVGTDVLMYNTTGNTNTAAGIWALGWNTTGSSNTAFGSNALVNNTTGSGNTALGFSALQSATPNNLTGSYNTGLGYQSLMNVQTTAAGNTALGYNTGATLTTGSNNILIGAGADVPGATQSNHLNIGNTIYGNLSTGNVGIGTASPSRSLHVYSANGSAFKIENNVSGNAVMEIQSDIDAQTAINFMNASGSTKGQINYQQNSNTSLDNYMSFQTNSLERMRIDNQGYVGIGSTTPQSRLTVKSAGSGYNAGLFLGGTTAASILPFDGSIFLSAGAYYEGTAWNYYNSAGASLLSMTETAGVIWYSGTGSSISNVAGGVTQWDATGYWKNLVRSTATGASYFTGGSVGIGTTSPAGNLHIDTTASPGTNASLFVIHTGSGNGSSSLQLKDNITGTADDNRLLIARLSNTHEYGGVGYIQNYVGGSYNGAIIINPGGGNVGIGTTSPTNKLHVHGTAAGSAGIYLNSAAPATNTYTLYNSGGTLYWNGLALLTSGTSSTNLYLGASAGAANPARSDDATTGLFSATSATVSTTISGTERFRVDANGVNLPQVANGLYIAGTKILSHPASDTTSIAVGPVALSNQTATNLYNTALGYYALNQTTTGDHNTAVGYVALGNNISGKQNAAFGDWTLASNITGIYNTGIGHGALTSNTTGNSNTAIGYESLFHNISGRWNTAIGSEALLSATPNNLTGDYNTGIGYRALTNIQTTAASNTALGYNAGYTVITGSSNLILGPGVASTTLTTGSGNILIGTSSLVDTTASNTSNFLNIGNALYGDLANDKIGIGTASPAAKLDIAKTTIEGSHVDMQQWTHDSGSYSLRLEQRWPATGRIYYDFVTKNNGTDVNALTFDTNGSIGIGTTSPTNRLHVEGAAGGSAGIYLNSAAPSATSYTLYNSGGTLYWNGAALLTTGTTTTSIYLGTNAGATNPSRSGDVTTGLFSATSATVSAAISGIERFQVNANGVSVPNIANGYYLGGNKILHRPASDTTSLGVGANTLTSQTATNLYNTAVGAETLAMTTSGIYNTGVGYATLMYNTTGNFNTAEGTYALYANTTGNNNTAEGAWALYNNTIGAENTSVGYRALQFNATGNYNTALGSYALFGSASPNSLTGSYNTGLGYGSLKNVQTTAASNTALGYNTGATLTTGSNNILIGANADVPLATQSNHLNIGNTIYGDLSTGNVGIGTTSPTYPLDVNGAAHINNYGTVTFTNYTGLTASIPGMFLAENATPYAGDGITEDTSFVGIFSIPKATTTNTNYITSAYGVVGQPTLDSSTAGARIALYGGEFTAWRNNANDLSAYSNNYLFGINVNAGHETQAPSSIITGILAGVRSNLRVYSGTTTTAYGYYSSVGVGRSTGPANPVITNYYGLYLAAPFFANGGAITNEYGIYQASATGKNYFAGNVGIGTTTPTDQLQIEGASAGIGVNGYETNSYMVSRFARGTSATPTIVQSGDVIGNIGFSGWDGAAWKTAAKIHAIVNGTPGSNDMPGALIFGTTPDGSSTSVERMRINNAGNVGIGTTGPAANGVGGSPTILQVHNSGTSVSILSLSNTDNSSGAVPGVLDFVSAGLSTTDKRLAEITAFKTDALTTYPAGSLAFLTASGNGNNLTEKMRITNNGNVGIGTTSPTNKLHVEGTAAGSAGIYLNSAAPSATSYTLYNSGGTLYWNGLALLTSGTSSTNLYLGASAGAANPARSDDATTGLYSSSAATVSTTISGIERFKVTANGVDLPQVANAYYLGGYKMLNFPAGDESSTAVGSGALVGQSATSLNNTAVGAWALSSNSTGNSNTAVGTAALSSTTTGAVNTAVGAWALQKNTTGGNNVAMGAGTLYENLTGDGNTAIGSWTLQYNTSGINNTAVGRGALYANQTGTNNLALGSNVGSVTLTTGSNNILIGTSSLVDTTSSGQSNYLNIGGAILLDLTNNTASGPILTMPALDNTSISLGLGALASQTATNLYNTAVGRKAMSSNTTGASNTAIGNGAAWHGTTASYNTALGNGALTYNTTGGYNTALGYMAMYSASPNNLTGNNNTALGHAALYRVQTTANANTAIGAQSLYNNTTGRWNTAVGAPALYSNTTGDGNTAYGTGAGQSILSGSNNVILGPNVASTTLTTGSSNILIGNSSLVDTTSSDQSNLLNIGNTIYGDLSTGNVGIGTTVSGFKLDVYQSSDPAIRSTRSSTSTSGGSYSAELMLQNADTTTNNFAEMSFSSPDSEGTLRQAASVRGIFTARTAGSITGDLAFLTTTAGTVSEKMRITSAGNVGIGTTSPTNKLHVQGTAAGSAGIYLNSAAPSATSYTLYNSGGTLYWNGLALLTSGTTSTNLYLGASAAAANPARSDDATTGLYSSSAATVSTTISGTERFKVNANGVDVPNLANAYYLAGNKVLFQPASDTLSIAVGPGALASQSATNLYNTAVGYAALNQNSTGSSNTAVGYSALHFNTTGYANNALGAVALENNTTGYANIAIGFAALKNTTTGSGNTAVGSDALEYNASGTRNTALGYGAMYGVTATADRLTGTDNTGIGAMALYYAQNTASNNTALGRSAGSKITTGSSNLLLGQSVGSTTLTTGSGNILIGTSSLVDTTASNQNNHLNIGNTLYGDLSTGYVGIGTTTPIFALDIAGEGMRVARYEASPSGAHLQLHHARGTKTTPTILSSGDQTGKVYFSGYDGSNFIPAGRIEAIVDGAPSTGGNMPGKLQFYTTPQGASGLTPEQIRMVIDNAGNTGIGTTSPQDLINATANVILDLSSSGIPSLTLHDRATTQQSGIVTNGAGLYIDVAGHATASNNTIKFRVGNTDSSYGVNTAMTITASGNVGIGTTSPVSRLDLGTNYSDPSTYPNKISLWRSGEYNYFGFGISSGSLDYFSQGKHRFFVGYNGSPGSEAMTISAAGRVGIGTASPTNKLHIEGTAAGSAGIYLNSAAPSATSYTLYNSGGTLYWNGLALLTSGTTSTNLYLGTSAASANPARSDDATTGLYSSSAATVSTTISGTERFKVNANGVDIPNIANAYYLGGNKILFQPASDTTSLAVGPGALATQTVTNLNNTAVGHLALYNNTTGKQNAAFGDQTLSSNITGNYNTANGYAALYSNTTGTSNTALGYGALYGSASPNQLTGNYNTAMGALSLYSIETTASGNTAIGYSTLRYTTTGASNTALGYGAMEQNTTGGYNTAVGRNALNRNLTGEYNTAVGTSAMMSSVANKLTGSYNTSIGHASLFSIETTASGNTALGYNSGYTLTTGASNLILGSGVASTTLTTGSNNILIGTSSLVDTTASGQSNHLNIGNTIYGDLSTSYVGIGTTSPLTNLHVFSTTDPAQVTVEGVGSVASNFVGLRAQGSVGALSAVQTDDNLAVFSGGGYGATGYSAATRVAINMVAAENWTDAAQGTYIKLSTTATGSTSKTERMRIDSSGYVGIGTMSPTHLLTLAMSSTSVASALSPSISITNTNAAMGDGVTTTNTAHLRMIAGSNGKVDTRVISVYDATFSGGKYGTNTNYPMAFMTNAIIRAVIDTSGNVGIGTTSPTNKLHVEGTAAGSAGIYLNNAAPSATSYTLYNSGGTLYWNGLALLTSGTTSTNLYLGTSAAAANPARSDDATTGLFSSSAATVSTTISGTERFRVNANGVNLPQSANRYYIAGNNALWQDAANFNLAVGNTAFPTTVAGGGSRNVAIGPDALAATATSNDNTAVGAGALAANTTGGANTALGLFALYSNGTGARNTALGADALYSNTTGEYNVASGWVALFNNVGGGYNSAYGSYALYNATTGSGNTALGAGALYSATPNNLTGSYNTGVGNNALHNVQTTAASNTALGYNAGHAVTTGASNLILGPGVGSTTLTTGSSNILIGTSSLVDTTASGQSNHLNIGNTIYGDLANARIGIGTTTPGIKLHIQQGAPSGLGAFMTTQDTVGIDSDQSYNFLTFRGGDSQAQGILFGDSVRGRGNIVYYNGGSYTDQMSFATAGVNDRMVITASGNVGIGTTSPEITLHVRGAESGISLEDTGVGNAKWWILPQTGNTTKLFRIYDVAAAADRLDITASGNVGIGTTSPSFKLHILSGNASDTQTLGAASGSFNLSNNNALYGLQMGVLSSGNAWMQVGRNDGTATAYNLLLQTLGGNVGIGTDAPTNKLHVQGTAAGSAGIYLNSAAPSATSYTLYNSGGTLYWNGLALLTSGTSSTNLYLGASAGAANPARSDDATTGLYSSSAATVSTTISGTERFRVDANGVDLPQIANGYYIGGTKILFQPASDTTSLAIGNGTLASQTATDRRNTAVGSMALNQTTTGNYNTANGYAALYSNTTGHYNTAAGYAALHENTTGINNAALGLSALYFNTEGSNNTAVGFAAMYSSTPNNLTGSYNTAVGHYSLKSIQTTAANNTALGAYTGSGITTGASNLILGQGVASTTLTTGSSNILIGTSSLVDTTASGQSNHLNIGNTIYGDLSTNYVGIGTTNPLSRLSVYGNSYENSLIRTERTSNDTAGPWVQLVKSRNEASASDGDNLGRYGFLFRNSAGDTFNAASVSAYAANVTDGTEAAYLAFDTSAGGVSVQERMRITATGNVGIGTTSPNTKLDVRGIITSGSATSTMGSVVLQGLYGTEALSVWGTEYSSGAPVMGYGVKPSTSATGSFLSSTSIAAARAAITVGGASGGGNIVFYTGTSQTVAVDSAVTTSPVMTIKNSGYVGIGTDTPAALFHVYSTTSIASRFDVSSSSTNVTSGVGVPFMVRNSSATSGNYASIMFYDANSNIQGSMGMVYGAHSAMNQGSFYIEPKIVATPSSFVVAPTGNVGIGTASPTNKLHVQGTAAGSAGIYLNSAAPSATSYTLYNSGGTLYWNGLALLTSGTTSTNLYLGTSAAAANPARSDDATTGLFSSSAATVSTTISGTERFRVNANGVDLPQITNGLYIAGYKILFHPASDAYSIAVGQGALASQTATNLYNTAVGYTALTQTTTGSYNTAVGALSLYSNTTGFYNTAVGVGALRSATPNNLTGSYNTAVGVNALYSVQTTAASNTALGFGAGDGVTTGANNTIIGYAVGSTTLATGSNNILIGTSSAVDTALSSTQNAIAIGGKAGTGDTAIGIGALNATATDNLYNTAVGYQALYQTTTGQNVAVGYRAAQGTTTGYNTTAVGFTALSLNTTGSDNTSVGAGSLQVNTTGHDNTALGTSALWYNTTGFYNTAVGVGALRSATPNNLTGSYNTAVGVNALYSVQTTAASNTALGFGAGDGVTTGANNTIIGYAVGSTTLATGSNNILIGINSAVDVLSASASNYLNIGNTIYGNTASGWVGIGTTSPTNKLHVVGGTNGANTGIFRIENNAGTSSNTGASIEFYSKENTPAQVEMARIGTLLTDGAAGAATSALAFYTRSSGTLAERMRISLGGSVGIGTATPAATLDVNGYMKLKTNSSAPVTCGSTYKGAIAYTGGTTNYLCFCNGTSWMQAHSPSTSCTW